MPRRGASIATWARLPVVPVADVWRGRRIPPQDCVSHQERAVKEFADSTTRPSRAASCQTIQGQVYARTAIDRGQNDAAGLAPVQLPTRAPIVSHGHSANTI